MHCIHADKGTLLPQEKVISSLLFGDIFQTLQLELCQSKVVVKCCRISVIDVNLTSHGWSEHFCINGHPF